LFLRPNALFFAVFLAASRPSQGRQRIGQNCATAPTKSALSFKISGMVDTVHAELLAYLVDFAWAIVVGVVQREDFMDRVHLNGWQSVQNRRSHAMR
jgi:hypothetical protein